MISGKLGLHATRRQPPLHRRKPRPAARCRFGALAGATWQNPREGYGKAVLPDRKYLASLADAGARGGTPTSSSSLRWAQKYVDETEAGLAIGIAVDVAAGDRGGRGARLVDRAPQLARPVRLSGQRASARKSGAASADAPCPPRCGPRPRPSQHALDQVEEGYRRLSTFNADVAHELRTPLANMMRVDDAGRAVAPPFGWRAREVLAVNLESSTPAAADRERHAFSRACRPGQEYAASLVITSLADETRKSAAIRWRRSSTSNT